MKKKRWLNVVIYMGVLGAMLVFSYAARYIAAGIAENAPIKNRYCFVIDAGHGGMDGGAVSCTGVSESEINLQIAVCLNDLFHLIGHSTKMTRTDDISLDTYGTSIGEKKASDLKVRTKMINETEKGILLCIHQNHYSDSFYSGAQMFYPKTEGSEQLAKKLQSAFVQTLNPGSHRQAKPAEGLYIMKHIEKVGVLIECGFLSNYEEEQKLRDPAYQKKVCCVIAAACSQYVHMQGVS